MQQRPWMSRIFAIKGCGRKNFRSARRLAPRGSHGNKGSVSPKLRTIATGCEACSLVHGTNDRSLAAPSAASMSASSNCQN